VNYITVFTHAHTHAHIGPHAHTLTNYLYTDPTMVVSQYRHTFHKMYEKQAIDFVVFCHIDSCTQYE